MMFTRIVLGRLSSAFMLLALYAAPLALAKDLTLADLFQSDRVIEVNITVASEDWETLRGQARDFADALGEDRRLGPLPSPYSYVNADVTIDGTTFSGVGIRKKGFIGSQSRSRPSLKLKLDFTDKKQQIEGRRVLTLNNNKQDQSLLSQYLGYHLFRKAGLPASRCGFARVTVNGKNLGVYSHVESVRKALIQREFGDDSGVLYEGTIVDFYTDWEKSFETKFGDDAVGRAKIIELTSLLNRKRDLESVEYEKEIGRYVDLPSFYSFWAMEGLLGCWDGYAGNSNNYFFYLNPETDRFHFLPWGTDSLFTEKGKFDQNPNQPLSVRTGGLIANRLYQIPEARAQYTAALQHLLEVVWDERTLLAESERVSAMVRPFVNEEQSKTERAQGTIREFIESRRERILSELADGAPDWNQSPRGPFVMDTGAFGKKQSWKPGEKEIFEAARKGSVPLIRKLVANGVSVDRTDRMGSTPLGLAVLFDRGEAVTTLVELGADPNRRGPDGSSLIHGAVFFGMDSALRSLLASGAEINAKNPQGQTALDIASGPWSDELEEMMGFMSNMLKFDLDVENVKKGRPELVRYLKSQGAKFGRELKSSGSTSIWQAAKEGDVSSLKSQVTDNTDLNARDEKGMTALSWAAISGHLEAVSWLLLKGADIDAANVDGGTALHSAAFLGHLEVVRVLLESGSNIERKDLKGQTAFDVSAIPWSPEMKGIAEFIGTVLELEVDTESMKTGRLQVAELLGNWNNE